MLPYNNGNGTHYLRSHLLLWSDVHCFAGIFQYRWHYLQNLLYGDWSHVVCLQFRPPSCPPSFQNCKIRLRWNSSPQFFTFSKKITFVEAWFSNSYLQSTVLLGRYLAFHLFGDNLTATSQTRHEIKNIDYTYSE